MNGPHCTIAITRQFLTDQGLGSLPFDERAAQESALSYTELLNLPRGFALEPYALGRYLIVAAKRKGMDA
jgi:hypothetical protein